MDMNKLKRDVRPEIGKAFIIMPYGEKELASGTPLNFDQLYHDVYVRVVEDCGMTPERADYLFGSTEGVLEAVWKCIQRAEVVVVDCTTRSADVAMELGLTMALAKRIVVLAQRLEDVPTDLRGRVRPILYEPAGLGVANMMQELKTQLQAVRREAVTENTLAPLVDAGTEPMPGTVVVVEKERAVVETDARGQQRLWALSNADVDYTHLISDMTRKFKIGDRLKGAVVTDFDGAERYTLLADQSNPWPGLVTDYPVGKKFTSRVVNMREGVGAFISVAHGIDGFVPYAEARNANLMRDAEVEVEILSVDAAARRVGLRLRPMMAPARTPALTSTPTPEVLPDLPAVGERLLGYVVRVAPEQSNRGGYLLLRLKGYESSPLAMLHITKMSPELRADLNQGHVDLDKEIMVEVLRVEIDRKDRSRMRINVLELPKTAHSDTEPSAA